MGIRNAIAWQEIFASLERVSFLLLTDQQGNILEANQKFSDLLGLKNEELCSTNIWYFVANPSPDQHVQEVFKHELQFISKSGYPFWLEMGITAVSTEEGFPQKFFWIGFDITERKTNEQYLADSQLLSKTIMQTAPVGLFLSDSIGSCTFVNEYWSRATGLPSSKAKGNGWQCVLHPDDSSKILRSWSNFIQQKAPYVEVQYRYLRADGSETWVQSSATPLKDTTNKVTGYLRVEQDITERIRSEKIITDQQSKIASNTKLSALGEMAGGIAHEINNPLAVIKNLSGQMQEILNEESLDKTILKEMASKVEKTTNRIAKIVQGLRSFSRDGSKDPSQEINVHRLIDETLSFCSERFKNHGTNLVVEKFEENLSFEGRETEISQVLLNLLNNAQDANIRLKDKWIKISVLDLQDWLEIRITDAGKGVPAEIRTKIFQPFFTTKEIGKGTGLGLSISSGIIHSHKGELKIDELCPNTCFVIRLPKKQPIQGSEPAAA